jgi:DNA-binding CsgD family transcriptional regulator
VPSSTQPPSRASLEEVTAATDYVSRVGVIVQKIESATNAVTAVELLREVTLCMGAEVSVFGSFMPEDRSGDSFRLLVACDPQWCSEYEAQSCFADDPWLAYAFCHSEPVRGSELKASSESEQSIVRLAERFGFCSCVIVPAPSCGRLARMGVLCLGSSLPGYFEGEGYASFKIVARSVAMEFHEWWLARIRNELIATARIGERDCDILALEAAGLTSKEIARRLTTTTATVDSRIRRIRLKLDAPSRRAASRLAAEYGLIQWPRAGKHLP